MPTLNELALKYGTDKSSQGHNYMPFYEKHLPKNPKRILEIGAHKGASLAMWAEYFPGAEIHALDLFEEYSVWDVCEFMGLPYDDYMGDKTRFHFHKGNQCDYRILEELRKYDFDLIIDDGSHLSRHQLMTFFGLFNGKHYFIEDLHCCRDGDFWLEGLPYEATIDAQFDFDYPLRTFMQDRDDNIILFCENKYITNE